MSVDIHKLRNIGIIAHIDAGKTTLTERMLFYSGATHRVGEVDKGTTETDFDEEEQQRGITIYSACVSFPWKEMTVNLIDTPGHVDFTAEVERSLRVLDGGVVVFSAREGVEAQSETVWRQADRYHVPRLTFINKMDREGADFEAVYEAIHERLHANPVALQIPLGQGPPHVRNAFRGIIDLIHLELLTFENDERSGRVIRQEIPEDGRDEAAHWREIMLEKLYDFSNELMELALQEEPIPEELLHRVIREATLHNHIQPVLCGSALDGIGVQPVLDAVTLYLPSPEDMPPVHGPAALPEAQESRRKHKKIDPTKLQIRRPDPEAPFCGLIFKVLPAKTGDFSFLRIYSGTLKAGSRVLNPGKNVKENVALLLHVQASHRDKIDQAGPGSIVGVIGLRHSITGDTLCDTREPIILETIVFPETVIAMAIEPETTTERKKLSEVLDLMRRQDPTFQAIENEETGQTLISGMGELHLEVIRHKLLRDFNLDVKVHKPRVSYRETIASPVEVQGICKRLIAGQQLHAQVRLRLTPDAEVSGVSVADVLSEEATIPGSMVQAVLDELEATAQGGGMIGSFPLTQMRVELIGADYQDESSTETAFRIAAAEGFAKGLTEAGPVLLEPIMRLQITTPEEYLGDFVGDLQQRRGIIVKTENRGGLAVIEARAPLANLFGYSSAMRSLSQGRGGCSMEPYQYAAAPEDVKEKFAF